MSEIPQNDTKIQTFNLGIPVYYFDPEHKELLESAQLPAYLKASVDAGILPLNHAVSLVAAQQLVGGGDFVDAVLDLLQKVEEEMKQKKTGLILPNEKNKSGLVVPR